MKLHVNLDVKDEKQRVGVKFSGLVEAENMSLIVELIKQAGELAEKLDGLDEPE